MPKKLTYFDNWLRVEMTRTLRSRYELGLQALELYEDEKKGGSVYGKGAIENICKVLRWDDGLIRSALKLVRVYTPEQMNGICKLVLPDGQPLNWSHLRTIILVRDPVQRQTLLDRTVAEGLTCTQVAREFTRLGQSRPDETRGRPPRLPKNFDEAVSGQMHAAAQWDRLHNQIWGLPERSLVAHASKLDPKDMTSQRVDQLRKLVDELRRVADQATEHAEKAEGIARDFARTLNEKSDQQKPSASAAAPITPAGIVLTQTA